MSRPLPPLSEIPAWNLYGEDHDFPDVLHIERIYDRAAGLDWTIAPHRHLHLHQIFLIAAGSTELSLDGSTLWPRSPFILTIPRGTVHGFRFSAGTEGHVVTIPLQSLPDIFGPEAALAAAIDQSAVLPASEDLARLVAELQTEHDGHGPGRTAILRGLALQLVAMVLRMLPAAPAGARGLPGVLFRRFEAMVQSRLRERLTVADHARLLGTSARHLSRVCRAATGHSATWHVQAQRMREACRLLVYTRAGIAEIGYQLGFDDPSYFTRAFARTVGQTPRAYRAAFE